MKKRKKVRKGKKRKRKRAPRGAKRKRKTKAGELGAARARLETRRHQRPVVVKGLVPKLRPVEAPPP